MGQSLAHKEELKEERHYRTHRWHPVYNIACIDDGEGGLQLQQWTERYRTTSFISQPISQVEDFITSTGAQIQHGGNVACYSPSSDRINLPRFQDFTSPEAYYATALHELTHWTGHPTRLNRKIQGRYGSQSYAFEELIAELGSAFLCNDIGIQPQLEHHASYLDSWLRLLKKDTKAFFRASQLATQAARFLCQGSNLYACLTQPFPS
ncbi:MAG: zincin-like metallopeptidase domain-containing protein [Thermostichus sp. DRC_bins_24]